MKVFDAPSADEDKEKNLSDIAFIRTTIRSFT